MLEIVVTIQYVTVHDAELDNFVGGNGDEIEDDKTVLQTHW